MALINCPECGKEGVSNTSTSCPQCGYNIKKHFDDIDKAEIAKQNEIKKAKNMKSFKKFAVTCTIILMSVLIIFATSAGIINAINDNIGDKVYHLTLKGNFDEALTKAEKIIFDDDLKNARKSDTILYSYVADCKRSCLDSDKALFERWFSEDWTDYNHKIKFYDNYTDYPYCILSIYDTTQKEYKYLCFAYDSEKGHYEACIEVAGLQEEDSSITNHDINDENYLDDLHESVNKSFKNSQREFIKSVIYVYPEIQTQYLHLLVKADNDNWKNVELLDAYNNYFVSN